jgi:PAS domain S-box-containing protein
MIFASLLPIEIFVNNLIMIVLLVCGLILIYLGNKKTILLGISYIILGIYTLYSNLISDFSEHILENIVSSLLFAFSMVFMGYFYLNQFYANLPNFKYLKWGSVATGIVLSVLVFGYSPLSSENPIFTQVPILVVISLYFIPIGAISLFKLTKTMMNLRHNQETGDIHSRRIFFIIDMGLILIVIMVFVRFMRLNLIANIGYIIAVITTTFGYYLNGRDETLHSRIMKFDKIRTELEDTSENYRAVVETTRNLILRSDLQGIIEYVNPAVHSFIKYTPVQLLKKQITDFVKERDRTLVSNVIARIRLGEIVSGIEFDLESKGGQIINVLSNFSPLFGPNNTIRGFLMICNDVTIQKTAINRVNEFLKYQYLLNDLSTMGMNIKLDSQQFLENALPLIASIIGFDRISIIKESEKKTYYRLIDWINPHRKETKDIIKDLSTVNIEDILKNNEIIQLTNEFDTSKRLYYQILPLRTHDKNLDYLEFEFDSDKVRETIRENSIVIDNIILILKQVINLLDYRNSLENLVKDRTTDLLNITDNLTVEVSERKKLTFFLKDALKEAMAASDAKSVFLANMSHELRTPLNAVIGFSELLVDSYKKDENNERMEFAENIHESGMFLLAYISKILELSRLESGMQKINVVNINIDNLLTQIISNYDKVIVEKHLTVTKHVSASDLNLKSDFDRLKIILSNIFENSVLYTSNKGNIDLSIKLLHENDKDYVNFIISDDGVGIPIKEQKKIFEPFVHIENRKITSQQRSGLGLYISKLYVETLGGKIWFESSTEKGTKFYVSIPKGFADEQNLII